MFFENSSLKGISGQNMSDPLKWSLTDDSRFLQAAILKNLTGTQQTPKPFLYVFSMELRKGTYEEVSTDLEIGIFRRLKNLKRTVQASNTLLTKLIPSFLMPTRCLYN